MFDLFKTIASVFLGAGVLVSMVTGSVLPVGISCVATFCVLCFMNGLGRTARAR